MQQLFGAMLGIFLTCVMAGSYFARRAILSLESQHRAELVTIVARLSTLSLVVPLVTAAIYAVVVIMNPELLAVATVGAFGVLLAQGVVGAVLAERAYRAASFPASFIKLFRLSRGVRILGSAVMFAGIVMWMLTRDQA